MSHEERLLEAEMAKACTSGDVETIDSVLNRSREGRESLYLMTGFYHAIIGKQIEIMKYLCERGAFIDKGGNGRQGFLAIKTTSIELLDTLYDMGWRPGTVALIYAVHHTDDDDVLLWLLDHGAQPDSFGGPLAMQGVVLANRFTAVDMLLVHGSSIGIALHLAAQRPECFEMVKFLVSRGGDVNSSGPLGSVLDFACSTANVKAASWLLEQGAVKFSNKFGKELALAEARLISAKDPEAHERCEQSPTKDEQGVCVRYFKDGGKWLTAA